MYRCVYCIGVCIYICIGMYICQLLCKLSRKILLTFQCFLFVSFSCYHYSTEFGVFVHEIFQRSSHYRADITFSQMPP